MTRIVAMLAVAGLFASAAAGAPEARVGGAGVSLALPAGWHSWVPSTAVQPTVTDPLTRVVAVSAPFRFSPMGCQVAGYAFPANAVAVVVLEWVPMKGLPMPSFVPARPSSFDSRALVLRPPPAIECFDGAAGSAEFKDHGRAFVAYLLAGRKASAATVARGRSVLDSLRVQRR
jgi:hypothetical protein